MKVPLVDLKVQLATIEKDLKARVNQVIDSTQYIQGPSVAELEKGVAGYLGSRFAVGVSSGTDALLVALMSLEVGPGDLVLTTPYSFFATAGCISRLGATPAFVDIDADTYNMCPRSLRAWLESDKERRARVKVLIPVHLFGQCADMDAILDIAREHNIPVLEDAAQAIGSTYESGAGKKRAGTMGLLGCFSFFPSKNLGALGDGGMVVTDDEKLAERVRMLRNHGAKPKYYHAIIGGNFRLDTIQAAALLAKLPHLDRWISMRRKVASYYDAGLEGLGIGTPSVHGGPESHVYHQYVISVPGERDALKQFLYDNDIQTAIYYPVSLHEQECFRGLGYRRGDFPDSERAAGRSLALPMYPEMTREMQDHVIKKIREFHG